jgi:hypothetical protein
MEPPEGSNWIEQQAYASPGAHFSEVCNVAARQGDLQALKEARARGFPWSFGTCLLAAERGHFEVLRWARENGAPWHEGVCTAAARNDDLEMLKWLRANGCPWDEEVRQVARGAVLEWAIANGAP